MGDRVALFDMDDTLVDFDIKMLRDLQSIQGPGDAEPIAAHVPDLPIYMQRRKHLIMQQRGWWRDLPEKKLGFQIMNIATQVGFTVNVLTKGPSTKPHAWLEKVEWCKKHLGNTPITITENKSLVYGRVLVDDYPQYMDGWLEWRKRGFGIMPWTSTNKDYYNPQVLKTDGTNLEHVRELLKAAYDRESGQAADYQLK